MNRDEMKTLCPAFGLGEDGRPGLDASTEFCQACHDQEKELYEACEAECAEKQPAAAVDAAEAADAAPAKKKASKTPKAPKVRKPREPRAPGLGELFAGYIKSLTPGQQTNVTIAAAAVPGDLSKDAKQVKRAFIRAVIFARYYGLLGRGTDGSLIRL